MGKSLFRKSWRPAAAVVSLAALTGCEPPAGPVAKSEPAPILMTPSEPIEPLVKKVEISPPSLAVLSPVAAPLAAPEPPPAVEPPPPEPEAIVSSLEAAALSRLFEDSNSAEAVELLGKRVELTGYVLQIRNLGHQRLVVLGDEHFTDDLPSERVLCHIEEDMREASNIHSPRLRVTGTCQLGYGNLVVLRNCRIEEELDAIPGFEERKLAFAAQKNRAELERLGVVLEGEEGNLTAKLLRTHLQAGRVAPEVLAPLAEIAEVRTLRFSGLPISDEGLAALPMRARLREIALDATRVSSQGLAALGEASELRRVTLDGTTLNDGFSHLANAHQLETLELVSSKGQSEFSEEAVQHLSAIRGLRRLGLDGARLSPKVMSWIAQQSDLESLSLEYTPINAELLQQLSGLKNLKSLSLRGSQFDDLAVAAVNELDQLEHLDVSCTQITDYGLAQLSPPATLKQLDLSGCRIVGRGLASLRGSNIEVLSLKGTRADNESMLAIESLVTLKQLQLGNTQITPAALSRLASLQRLEELDLLGIRLDRDALPVLEGLSALRQLRLSENPFDDCESCLAALSVSRPQLRLYLGRFDYVAQATAAQK